MDLQGQQAKWNRKDYTYSTVVVRRIEVDHRHFVERLLKMRTSRRASCAPPYSNCTTRCTISRILEFRPQGSSGNRAKGRGVSFQLAGTLRYRSAFPKQLQSTLRNHERAKGAAGQNPRPDGYLWPGQTVKISHYLDAPNTIGGQKALDHVEDKPEPKAEAVVASWAAASDIGVQRFEDGG